MQSTSALRGPNESLSYILESSNIGGGDTDTIGAMAGAIWGAYNGFNAVPSDLLHSTEGVEEMNALIHDLRKMHPTSQCSRTPLTGVADS